MTPGTIRKTVKQLTEECYESLPDSIKEQVVNYPHNSNLVYLLDQCGVVCAGFYHENSSEAKVYRGDKIVSSLSAVFANGIPGYHRAFSEEEFKSNGYQLMSEISAIVDACKYPLEFRQFSHGHWTLSYYWRHTRDDLIWINIEKCKPFAPSLYWVYFSFMTRVDESSPRKSMQDSESGDDLSIALPFLAKHDLIKREQQDDK